MLYGRSILTNLLIYFGRDGGPTLVIQRLNRFITGNKRGLLGHVSQCQQKVMIEQQIHAYILDVRQNIRLNYKN